MARIILFDIDQTLLYSGGAGGLAMRKAFHQPH
ncbi:MAG: HAD family hydrolase, partial [Chloroflexi bacterium]|nr:HAD family hydrolase [Chloroflexota bacterium]